MSPEKRIKEFKTRQIWYGSSTVIKLRKMEGVFHYDVFLWINQGLVDNKSLIKTGLYENQDPEVLLKEIEQSVGRFKSGSKVVLA